MNNIPVVAGARIFALGLFVMLVSGVLGAKPAQSDWRTELKVLRIGVVADVFGRDTAAEIDPFRVSLELALDIRVNVFVYNTARALILAHSRAQVHYAIYSASAYAAAWTSCQCVTPLVAGRGADGKLGYHAILAVRRDSRYQSLGDVVGERLLFAGAGSVAGDLLPRAAFHALGVDSQTLKRTSATADGPMAAMSALLDGRAEAAFAWSSLSGEPASGYSHGTLRRLFERGIEPDLLRIIWRSRLIPPGPHAIHTGVPSEARTEIVSVLVDMADADPRAYDAVERVWSGGFEAIGHSAYQSLVELFSKAADPTPPQQQ